MRRNTPIFHLWVWWLRAAGKALPAAHIAFVLDTTQAVVEAVPPQDLPPTRLDISQLTGGRGGNCRGPNASKILRLHTLGYSAAEIARCVRRQPHSVACYLRRMTAADGSFLTHPRTPREQRTFERCHEQVLARAVAKAARKAAAWPRSPDMDPPPELRPGQAVAELASQPKLPAAPAPLCERWDETAVVRVRGSYKLTEAQIAEARTALLTGLSFADVAHRFGCSLATIRRLLSDVGPRTPAGERNGFAKLSWETVGRMKTMHEQGASYRAIGRHFGVNYETARRAILGLNWGNTPDVPDLPALPPPVQPDSILNPPPQERHQWHQPGGHWRIDPD